MNMDYAAALTNIREYVERELQNGTTTDTILQEVLGRKGRLTAVLRTLKDLSPEERQRWGSAANELKVELERRLDIKEAVRDRYDGDPTVPAYRQPMGSIHPISAMIEEMAGIFQSLSFEVVEGNEIVSDYDNFESLNLGKDHPARDGQDSFYVGDELLLRAQMTALQVPEMRRRMKANQMPIRIVMPGKTYRRESDPTHSPMFHQIDAVMVDTQTTFSDLKGILHYLAERLFGSDVETRFRPHHFPFTEPSAELDIRWKDPKRQDPEEGWLEMGGCGMIHPEVLKRAGINPRIYQGWAFGMSIERPIMVRHQVKDLRLFFQNEREFLNQMSNLS